MREAPKSPPGHPGRHPQDRPPHLPASYRHVWMQGQCKAEGSSGALVRSRPQTPTMHLNNRPVNRQAHSHAVLFRGEEGVEDRRWMRDAAAAIADLDKDVDAVAP